MPWDDLVYIFGEIMYGGHIVEDWDRRLANAYLARYFTESLLEGAEFFPGFTAPPSTLSHKQARAPSFEVFFCGFLGCVRLGMRCVTSGLPAASGLRLVHHASVS